MMKNLQNMLLLIGVSSSMAILAGHENPVNKENDDITSHSDNGGVRQAARIIRGPKTEEMASKGSNVTINCNVEHSTRSKVTWEFNNTEIIQGKKYMVNHNNGDLVVRNVGPQDQGTYRCSVSSDGGVEDFKEGKLVVLSSTTIVDGPEDGLVEVWSRVNMNCTVLYDMEDNLTVTWYKDGRMLGGINYQEEDISFGRNTHYGLILSNVTMDDAGNYTCWARTNSSQHRVTGNLEVFGIPPVLSGMQSLEAMESLQGDDVMIECTVEKGYPKPLVSWFKDNIPVQGERFQLKEDNSLVISKSNVEDSGVYKCVAKNDAGEDSQEVRVDVRRKTIIENKAESFVYNEGREVIIDCQVVVDPNLERYLTVSWYKGEEELNNLAKIRPVFGGGMEGSELNEFQMYEEGSGSEESEDDDRVVLMANNSLKIFKMKEGDLGEYSCKANILKDGMEDLVISEASKIYIEALFPWWIIAIPFLIIVIVVIFAIIVIFRLRKGLAVKGNYNVKDVEGNAKKIKKTDIYYLPSDLDYDSFMNACTPTPKQTPCCGTRNVLQQSNKSATVASRSTNANNYEHLI